MDGNRVYQLKYEMNSGEYPMKNIVIIGMPGAGKSTMGVILLKTPGTELYRY